MANYDLGPDRNSGGTFGIVAFIIAALLVAAGALFGCTQAPLKPGTVHVVREITTEAVFPLPDGSVRSITTHETRTSIEVEKKGK